MTVLRAVLDTDALVLCYECGESIEGSEPKMVIGLGLAPDRVFVMHPKCAPSDESLELARVYALS